MFKMASAIRYNNIEAARALLEAGENPSNCLYQCVDGTANVSTLCLCVHNTYKEVYTDMAKLLIEKGACFPSQKEESVAFINALKLKIEYEDYSFEEFMPILRAVAENGLIKYGIIVKISNLAPEADRERVRDELSSLLPEKKSHDEVRKNAFLLFQAQETFLAQRKAQKPITCLLGSLPETLLPEIAALTANHKRHEDNSYKKASEIAIFYFQKLTALKPLRVLPSADNEAKASCDDHHALVRRKDA